VHFANSTEEQVDRIASLGAIVSANPCYPCGFADKYSAVGLGSDRADVMVRARSVLDRAIPLSLHSEPPMAPAEPLRLAAFAVNRRTESGRVAAPEQRISVDSALRASRRGPYSRRREHEIGSIAAGKLATFTVLGADPYLVDPEHLGNVSVIGIVSECRGCRSPGARRRRPPPSEQGNQAFYRIIDPCVSGLLELGMCLVEQNPKSGQFRQRSPPLRVVVPSALGAEIAGGLTSGIAPIALAWWTRPQEVGASDLR
jgi:hypothetical protein